MNVRLIKIVTISLAGFLILISAYNILLETVAKPLIQQKLPHILKRKIEIERMYSLSFTDLKIKNLVLYNAGNKYPLYYFKVLKIKPSIISMLFDKKLRFNCEILPTKKFKAHIYITGTYDLTDASLMLKFKLKGVPYTEELGSIYGTLHLYKKPINKTTTQSADGLDITFTSQRMLLAVTSEIINNDGKTEIKGKLASPFIKTDKFQIYNILSDAALIDDKLYIYNFNCNLYKGTVSMDSYIDLKNPINPSACSVNIKAVDITEFSRNSTLFKREIRGIMQAKAKLKGSMGHKESLYGTVWLEITDVNLWESNLFSGLASALMIPNLKQIIFTDAYGAFHIKNSKIETQNFKLVASALELNAKGRIGFDESIDTVIKIKFKKELIDSSSGLSKLSSLILESAGWFLGNLRISGTLKEPVFTITPIGVGNILDKVKNVLDKFKGILK